MVSNRRLFWAILGSVYVGMLLDKTLQSKRFERWMSKPLPPVLARVCAGLLPQRGRVE